jgi:hypothetical protein
MQFTLGLASILTFYPLMAASAGSHPELQIEKGAGGFKAVNASQSLVVRFDAGRTEFQHRGSRFTLELLGAGPVMRTSIRENRIEYERAGLTEWYVNQPEGVEHGFTVAQRGARRLELTLQVGGDLRPELGGADVMLRATDGTMLRYGGLVSRNMDGRPLPSHAVVEGRTIRISVDDSRARYPVTVDPVVQEARLSVSDSSIAPEMGTSVALNGTTALVGAPNSGAGKGVVYVFEHAGAVWSHVANITAPDAVAGDLFGFSVALDGDTALIGAPQKAGGGGAYVFVRSAGVWNLQQLLTTPPHNPLSTQLGHSVAVCGDLAIVASVGVGQQSGTAFFYTRSGVTWNPGASVFTQSGGSAAACSGKDLVIGDPVLAQAVLVNGDNQAITVVSGKSGYGTAVAIDSSTAAVSELSTGTVFIFTKPGLLFSGQATITASDPVAGDLFGASLALSGDTLVVGAPNHAGGTVYLFTRNAGVWTQQAKLTVPAPTGNTNFGASLAAQWDTILVGAPLDAIFSGAAYSYRISNISLDSTPAGRAFTVSGDGCRAAGTFATPYTGLFNGCAVQWTSPDTSNTGTRYTFQNWSDDSTQNPRSFSLPTANLTVPAYSFAANFLTEYQLTAQSSTPSGGTVTGAGFYTAGVSAGVVALANPGFVFTGFSGALSANSSPQILLMDAPKTVTGTFVPTPPAVLSANITAKSGPLNNRQWTITVSNSGPGTGYAAQLFGVMLTQTFGTLCAPVRQSPLAFPVSLGTLGVGGSAQVAAIFDFTGCASNARFTASLGSMSNGGSSDGLVQLVNQLP